MKVKYKVIGLSLNIKNRGKRVHRMVTLELPDGLSLYQQNNYPSDNSNLNRSL